MIIKNRDHIFLKRKNKKGCSQIPIQFDPQHHRENVHHHIQQLYFYTFIIYQRSLIIFYFNFHAKNSHPNFIISLIVTIKNSFFSIASSKATVILHYGI
jgi:hypothetical protein